MTITHTITTIEEIGGYSQTWEITADVKNFRHLGDGFEVEIDKIEAVNFMNDKEKFRTDLTGVFKTSTKTFDMFEYYTENIDWEDLYFEAKEDEILDERDR